LGETLVIQDSRIQDRVGLKGWVEMGDLRFQIPNGLGRKKYDWMVRSLLKMFHVEHFDSRDLKIQGFKSTMGLT
jgi:hypothetical protein